MLFLYRPPQTYMPFARPLNYSYTYTPAASPAPAVAPASAPSLADELKKLAALRDAGHLTDDEFAAAKAKLLAGD